MMYCWASSSDASMLMFPPLPVSGLEARDWLAECYYVHVTIDSLWIMFGNASHRCILSVSPYCSYATLDLHLTRIRADGLSDVLL